MGMFNPDKEEEAAFADLYEKMKARGLPMVRTHHLKSWPEFFVPIHDGRKSFELRKNDRGYKADDVLVLREWEPKTGEYSGREVRRRVVYVLEGIGTGGIEPLHGLKAGYVILGLEWENE